MHMHIVIMITAKDRKEGCAVIKSLLKKRLIACGNLVDKVSSFFWWENKIQEAHEVLILLKTQKDKFEKVKQAIKKMHSYEVPEIIAVPITDGNEEYVHWMNKVIK